MIRDMNMQDGCTIGQEEQGQNQARERTGLGMTLGAHLTSFIQDEIANEGVLLAPVVEQADPGSPGCIDQLRFRCTQV